MQADLQTDRGEAREIDDAAMAQTAAEAHHKVARMWLHKKRKAVSETAGITRPKKHRRKSWQWLATLDNAMKSSTTHGLATFQVSTEKLATRADPLNWPLALGVADKGPDSVCSAAFLNYKLHCNVDMTWDTAHGAWGSCRDGVQRAGLSSHLWLALMAYNVGLGEWKDRSRQEQIKQSIIDNFKTSTTQTDVCWQVCVADILNQRGCAWSEEMEEAIYSEMEHGGCMRTTLPRVSMTRFFGIIKRFRDYESWQWAERKYGLMTACIDLGLLEKAL